MNFRNGKKSERSRLVEKNVGRILRKKHENREIKMEEKKGK